VAQEIAERGVSAEDIPRLHGTPDIAMYFTRRV
jgi:hypothetical protein